MSLNKVDSRVRPFRKRFKAELIKGFYSESLAGGPEALGIKKARIILIDCDTYTAAKDVFGVWRRFQGVYCFQDWLMGDAWIAYLFLYRCTTAKSRSPVCWQK
jgi:hypothetical protein